MPRLYFLPLAVASAILAAACLRAAPPVPIQPGETTVPPTSLPSATPVWFPPTQTAAPLIASNAAVTPTLDRRPAIGELLFVDDFSDETLWTTGRSASGGVAVQNNELTLAVSRPDGYLYSLRQGTPLADFYAEITANPTLCSGADEYGLLLRFSAGGDFYRYSLTCSGQARLDKFYQGAASSPQGLTPSGAVPRGAPSSSRLGVLAKGNELRFYVNGEYQFSVRDPSLRIGSLGMFARAGGDNAVTVNFSDLQVFQAAGN